MLPLPPIDMDYRPPGYWNGELPPPGRPPGASEKFPTPPGDIDEILEQISGGRGAGRRSSGEEEEGENGAPEEGTPVRQGTWDEEPHRPPGEPASVAPRGGSRRLRRGPVEIASIGFSAVLSEPIIVRARGSGKRIRYEVVKGRDSAGPVSYRFRPRTSTRPLTMRQLVRLIDGAHEENEPPGAGLVLGNLQLGPGGAPLPSQRHFVAVTSRFYPHLDSYYDWRVQEWRRRAGSGLPPDALDGPALWLKEASERRPARRPDVIIGWEGRQALLLCRTPKAAKWARRRYGRGFEESLHRDGMTLERLVEAAGDLSSRGLSFEVLNFQQRRYEWLEEHIIGYMKRAYGRLIDALNELIKAEDWIYLPRHTRRYVPTVAPLQRAAVELAQACGQEPNPAAAQWEDLGRWD